MILPIYIYGNQVLRKKSVDINATYPDLQRLIADMFETMNQSHGVGLAAPQIGRNINLFIIDTSPVATNDTPELREFKRVFINPHLTFNTTAKISIEEGCLSVPDISEHVDRCENITVDYLNENFEPVSENVNDYRAIVVQHEYDHLHGIMFVDKISSIRKHFIKNRLANISKGKVIPNYKIKL